jgi:hypothetical protein
MFRTGCSNPDCQSSATEISLASSYPRLRLGHHSGRAVRAGVEAVLLLKGEGHRHPLTPSAAGIRRQASSRSRPCLGNVTPCGCCPLLRPSRPSRGPSPRDCSCRRGEGRWPGPVGTAVLRPNAFSPNLIRRDAVAQRSGRAGGPQLARSPSGTGCRRAGVHRGSRGWCRLRSALKESGWGTARSARGSLPARCGRSRRRSPAWSIASTVRTPAR